MCQPLLYSLRDRAAVGRLYPAPQRTKFPDLRLDELLEAFALRMQIAAASRKPPAQVGHHGAVEGRQAHQRPLVVGAPTSQASANRSQDFTSFASPCVDSPACAPELSCAGSSRAASPSAASGAASSAASASASVADADASDATRAASARAASAPAATLASSSRRFFSCTWARAATISWLARSGLIPSTSKLSGLASPSCSDER